MTFEEIQQRVQAIRDTAWDFEVAHSLEDKLYRDFVAWIASGAECDGMVLADLAGDILKTREIAFSRYTA